MASSEVFREDWPTTPPALPPMYEEEKFYEKAMAELPACPPPYDWQNEDNNKQHEEVSDGCIASLSVGSLGFGALNIALAAHADTIDEPWARTLTSGSFGLIGMGFVLTGVLAGTTRLMTRLEARQQG